MATELANQAIEERLAEMVQFHPATVDMFDGWLLDPGDIVNVSAGEDVFRVPVYHQHLEWRGNTKTEIQSTGSEKRPPLSALRRMQYASSRLQEEEWDQLVMHQADIEKSNERLLLWATEEQWNDMAEQWELSQKSAFEVTSSQIQSVVLETGSTAGVYNFDPEHEYVYGEKCMYNGVLYRCKNPLGHTGAWNSADFDTVQSMQSMITQTKNSISLIVDGNGVVTPASLILAINNDGQTSAAIKADKVLISGNTTLDGTMYIDGNGILRVKKNLIIESTTGRIISMNNGTIAANNVNIRTGGALTLIGSQTGEYYNLTASNYPDFIRKAQVENNTLKLWKVTDADATPSITFNKATAPTIGGSWNGSGTYTITSDPAAAAGSKMTVTPSIRLNGNGGYAFAAELLDDTEQHHLQKTAPGYLIADGNTVTVYTKYEYGGYTGAIASCTTSGGSNLENVTIVPTLSNQYITPRSAQGYDGYLNITVNGVVVSNTVSAVTNPVYVSSVNKWYGDVSVTPSVGGETGTASTFQIEVGNVVNAAKPVTIATPTWSKSGVGNVDSTNTLNISASSAGGGSASTTVNVQMTDAWSGTTHNVYLMQGATRIGIWSANVSGKLEDRTENGTGKIEANGTFEPSPGYIGFSRVEVAVQGAPTAPTIGGSWNSDGNYVITSSPAAAAGSKLLVSPQIRLNGNGSAAFSAEMLDDTSQHNVRKSVPGYLHQSGATVGVYKTYNSEQGTYSDVIASIAVTTQDPTITGSWQGNGTYHITSTPSAAAGSKLNVTATPHLNGNGQFSNFSAEVWSDDATPVPQSNSVRGYLHQVGDYVGVYTSYDISTDEYANKIAQLQIETQKPVISGSWNGSGTYNITSTITPDASSKLSVVARPHLNGNGQYSNFSAEVMSDASTPVAQSNSVYGYLHQVGDYVGVYTEYNTVTDEYINKIAQLQVDIPKPHISGSWGGNGTYTITSTVTMDASSKRTVTATPHLNGNGQYDNFSAEVMSDDSPAVAQSNSVYGYLHQTGYGSSTEVGVYRTRSGSAGSYVYSDKIARAAVDGQSWIFYADAAGSNHQGELGEDRYICLGYKDAAGEWHQDTTVTWKTKSQGTARPTLAGEWASGVLHVSSSPVAYQDLWYYMSGGAATWSVESSTLKASMPINYATTQYDQGIDTGARANVNVLFGDRQSSAPSDRTKLEEWTSNGYYNVGGTNGGYIRVNVPTSGSHSITAQTQSGTYATRAEMEAAYPGHTWTSLGSATSGFRAVKITCGSATKWCFYKGN